MFYEEIFLHAQKRCVNKYGVISFEGNTYEAPAELIGKNVVVRYNPFHLEYLHIYYQDKSFGYTAFETFILRFLR
jgi:putative transposase